MLPPDSRTQITIPIHVTEWLTANDRLHWARRARRTRALRTKARFLARGVLLPVTGPSRVIVHIAYPSNGRADPANAAPAVKAIIDGLVDAGIFPDDDSTHIRGVEYRRDPKTGQAGQWRIRIVIHPDDRD